MDKIKIYKFLGAEQMQRFVFKVEKIKFKFIKRYWPNYLSGIEKSNQKNLIRRLKYAKTEEERNKIKEYFIRETLITKKEFEYEENRNYHIDKDNILNIFYYLKRNKKIHINELLRDLIVLGGEIVILIISPSSILVPLFILSFASIILNLECINLQNYNLARLEEKKEQLAKIANKANLSDLKKYSEIAKVTKDVIKEADRTPTLEDLLNNISSKKEAVQLLNLIEREIKTKENIEKGRKH